MDLPTFCSLGKLFLFCTKVLLVATVKPIRELLIVPVGKHVFAIKSDEVSRKSVVKIVLRCVRVDPYAEGRV